MSSAIPLPHSPRSLRELRSLSSSAVGAADLVLVDPTVLASPSSYRSHHNSPHPPRTPGSGGPHSLYDTASGPLIDRELENAEVGGLRGRVCKAHADQWLSAEAKSVAVCVEKQSCDLCNSLGCVRCHSFTMQIMRLNEPCTECRRKQKTLDDLIVQFHTVKDQLNARWYRGIASIIYSPKKGEQNGV